MSIKWRTNVLAAALMAALCPFALAQLADKPAPQPAEKPVQPDVQPNETKTGEVPAIIPAPPPGKSPVKIGDPAPELKVLSWVKGEPVKGYEKGKVYVIELWATWCVPCMKSIPELTQLQHDLRGKGVRVIGVSIWENTRPNTIPDLPADGTDVQVNAAYLARVKSFVQGMGDKMDYTVAFDGIEGSTGAWMFRTGQNSIPCTFVVNREGKLAWVGHPAALTKPDGPLAQILAGTYNLANAPNQIAKDAAKDRKIHNLEAKYNAAKDRGDKAAELAVIDDFVELSPEEFQKEVSLKFRTLLIEMKDEKGAYEYARKVSTGPVKDLYEPLNDMAWMILDENGVVTRDLELALTLAQRADEAAKHEVPTVMDTLARAYFDKGDVDKAIETQTKAIALLSDNKADATLRRDLETSLRKYQGAKK